jgi:transcriptional regulator with XRE-family HTH domain
MVIEDMFLVVLRRRIKQRRNALGITQEVAAEKANMTLRHYQTFEIEFRRKHGEREFNPTLKSLRGIAQALDVSLLDLLRDPSLDELKLARG